MKKSADSAEPAFWNQRYRSAETPWVLHKIPNALSSFLKRTKCGDVDVAAPSHKGIQPAVEVVGRPRVLVPGCGTHHEVILAFRTAGFDVVAIDFSAVAIAETRDSLGRSRAGGLVHGDFFKHNFRERFDLIYERTFLCAMHPRRWPRYAKRMAQLLRPGGKLVGIFFYGTEPDPPPYPIKTTQAAEIFGEYFRLVRDLKVSDSLPMFAGMERWQEWERKTVRHRQRRRRS